MKRDGAHGLFLHGWYSTAFGGPLFGRRLVDAFICGTQEQKTRNVKGIESMED